MSVKKLQENLVNENYLERTQRNQFFIGGPEGQERIRNLTVGVAGLGGMGSNIAEYLARLGVENLHLADADTIDVSNINRQVIANFNSVGTRKLDASVAEIKRIAPEANLKPFKEGITAENVYDFVEGCDFIVDEIDVFPIEAHHILHKACRERGIPIYSAYVIGLGVHFYKFEGDQFTFEDFLSINEEDDDSTRLDKIMASFMSKKPEYLNEVELQKYKKMAQSKGVPIFGPSCLLGHTVVLSRILSDFLGGKLLGTELPQTPVMPNFLSIDLMTMQISIEEFKK